MQYKAVILNFDNKTATYVAPRDVAKTKKAKASVTGTNPPARAKS